MNLRFSIRLVLVASLAMVVVLPAQSTFVFAAVAETDGTGSSEGNTANGTNVGIEEEAGIDGVDTPQAAGNEADARKSDLEKEGVVETAPSGHPPQQPSRQAQDDGAPQLDASDGDGGDTAIEKQVRVQRNLRFSSESGRAGLCDVYLPANEAPPAGYPVVVVVHGGAWLSGDKWTLESYSRRLAEHNMAAVTINYRLAPSHKFPAQVDDVRSALIWAKENAGRFHWDPDCLGIFGYSAGGHLCALIGALADEAIEVQAAASDWPANDKKWTQLPSIRAVCAGGPPCDFRTLPQDNLALAYFLGGSRRERPETYVSASPAAHVSASDPVTQIIHGDSDLLVPLIGSQKFHDAQVEAGIDSRLEVMPNQGHMVTFLNPKTSNKMVDFFYEVLEVETRME